jgi:hypothetical protein
VLWQLSCAVVQASWHAEPIVPLPIVAVDVVCAAIDDPLAPGTTQVVWHCAKVELHDIMQVVTAEVTFEVCGVTGVKGWACARAALQPRTADDSTAATVTTIAPHRMIVSASHADATAAIIRIAYDTGNRPRIAPAAPSGAFPDASVFGQSAQAVRM